VDGAVSRGRASARGCACQQNVLRRRWYSSLHNDICCMGCMYELPQADASVGASGLESALDHSAPKSKHARAPGRQQMEHSLAQPPTTCKVSCVSVQQVCSDSPSRAAQKFIRAALALGNGSFDTCAHQRTRTGMHASCWAYELDKNPIDGQTRQCSWAGAAGPHHVHPNLDAR
jgi:hypothetical protein